MNWVGDCLPCIQSGKVLHTLQPGAEILFQEVQPGDTAQRAARIGSTFRLYLLKEGCSALLQVGQLLARRESPLTGALPQRLRWVKWVGSCLSYVLSDEVLPNLQQGTTTCFQQEQPGSFRIEYAAQTDTAKQPLSVDTDGHLQVNSAGHSSQLASCRSYMNVPAESA